MITNVTYKRTHTNLVTHSQVSKLIGSLTMIASLRFMTLPTSSKKHTDVSLLKQYGMPGICAKLTRGKIRLVHGQVKMVADKTHLSTFQDQHCSKGKVNE